VSNFNTYNEKSPLVHEFRWHLVLDVYKLSLSNWYHYRNEHSEITVHTLKLIHVWHLLSGTHSENLLCSRTNTFKNYCQCFWSSPNFSRWI